MVTVIDFNQTAEIAENVLIEAKHVCEREIQEIFNSIIANRVSLEKLRDEMAFVRDLNVTKVLSDDLGIFDTSEALDKSIVKVFLQNGEVLCNLMERGLSDFIQESLDVEQKLIPRIKEQLKKTGQNNLETAIRHYQLCKNIFKRFDAQGKSFEKISTNALNQTAQNIFPLLLNWQKMKEYCARVDRPFSDDFAKRCRLIYLA